MIRRDLLFEIGTEEIPARFMTWVIRELETIARAVFADLRLAHGELRVTGAPRRIALIVHELADRQEDLEEQVKGPPKTNALDADGNYTKAALGFAKSRGIETSDLRFEEVKGVEYLFAVVREEGRAAREILPGALAEMIRKLVFPKNMYWRDASVRFARPIRWLVALFDDMVIDLDYGGITSGRTSRGHRFMGAREVRIDGASGYLAALERESVIADHLRRKAMIADGIKGLERELGCRADDDPDLLEENAQLVEYPVPFAGSFEERYLDIPEEVLIATMKKNQRYFPVRGADGKLAPHFIGVSNNRAKDMAVVREGNERVLRARLNDAEFFWKEDRQRSLESRLPELKKVLYQEKLGSVFDKSERARTLAGKLAQQLGLGSSAAAIDRAAALAKADLVTGMVFEFPEVQGVMGREYARLEGEPDDVCRAIFEQYLPRYAGDDLPSGKEGAVLGIADRVDSMIGIHKVGLAPTGSQDPYALRRAARSINEIVWGLGLDVDMASLFADGAALLDADGAAMGAVEAFYRQRLHVQLRERGYGHGTTSLAVASMGMRPLQALRMLEAFEASSGEAWFASLIQSAVRVGNILGKLSGDERGAKLDEGALSLEPERALKSSLDSLAPRVRDAVERSDWKAVCSSLAELSPAISSFFDGVMVMDPDPAVRANRISLLASAKGLFDLVGDLSLLKQ